MIYHEDAEIWHPTLSTMHGTVETEEAEMSHPRSAGGRSTRTARARAMESTDGIVGFVESRTHRRNRPSYSSDVRRVHDWRYTAHVRWYSRKEPSRHEDSGVEFGPDDERCIAYLRPLGVPDRLCPVTRTIPPS